MAALDFAGMQRAGLAGLGLSPREFWDLTPCELAIMLGLGAGAGALMTRSRLEALAGRFPDQAKPAAQNEGYGNGTGD